MADMYKRIDELLTEKGITGAKMSSDLGMSRSFMTELRKGRAKSVKLETAQKIADYFGVSVHYLTGEDDNKNAPTVSGERNMSDAELKFALWGGCEDITDEDVADVRRYAAFLRERKKSKK